MKSFKIILLFLLVLLSTVSYSQDSSKSNPEISQNKLGQPNPLPTFPQFPGGYDSMTAFIRKHTHYPKAARKQGISGIVEVYFTVALNGSIKNPKVSKSLGYGCDEEAIRVVNLMPKWIPARKGREPMELNSTVNIPFGKQE